MAIPDDIAPEASKKEQPEDPFKSLVEWSKWLITINFAAATGCVITLQGALEKPDPNLFLLIALMGAIISFCFSVGCSVHLIFKIAIAKASTQPIPLITLSAVPNDEHPPNEYQTIGKRQFTSFVIALAFLCLWVAIKVFKPLTTKTETEQCCSPDH